MIVRDLVEIAKIAKARSRSYLWYTPYSVPRLLEEIRGRHFPQVTPSINVYAVDRGSLACICDRSDGATIYVHQILNHTHTPIEVFQLIHKHEMLHLLIPPREIEGTTRMHPSEFWEAERKICPESAIVWAWVWNNLGDCLKRCTRQERIDVLGNWKKVWSVEKSSIEDVNYFVGKHEGANQEEGW